MTGLRLRLEVSFRKRKNAPSRSKKTKFNQSRIPVMGEHNMTKLILSASLLAILATMSNAYADASVSQSIEITGTVVTGCTLTNEDSAPFAFEDKLVDGQQKANQSFDISRKLGDVTCNYPANISVKTTKGALKTATADCNFQSAGAHAYNCIGYEAILAWNSVTAVVGANGDADSAGRVSPNVQALAPFSGEVTLTVVINSETDRPVTGGSYSDTLVVQIGEDL
jgi:hypothetical protein